MSFISLVTIILSYLNCKSHGKKWLTWVASEYGVLEFLSTSCDPNTSLLDCGCSCCCCWTNMFKGDVLASLSLTVVVAVVFIALTEFALDEEETTKFELSKSGRNIIPSCECCGTIVLYIYNRDDFIYLQILLKKKLQNNLFHFHTIFQNSTILIFFFFFLTY